jgi:hypothetical protein
MVCDKERAGDLVQGVGMAEESSPMNYLFRSNAGAGAVWERNTDKNENKNGVGVGGLHREGKIWFWSGGPQRACFGKLYSGASWVSRFRG